MEKTYHSLKDFELSYGKNAIERANDFQQYIEQLNDFGCKSYWITSHTGIGSTMAIEGFNEPVIAFMVGSINSIFYFLHKAAEPFNCLEQDNLA